MAINISKVSDGLGFGDGSISAVALQAKVGDKAFADAATAIESPQIVVPIDTDGDGVQLDDDGCGDGRAVGRVFKGRELKGASLHRAKVFGGGAAMTAATLIGLGRTDGKSLEEVFKESISLLASKGVDFGAHSADHVGSASDSGCGAIDKAPAILQAAGTYRAEIQATIVSLGFSTDGLDDVFQQFAAEAAATANKSYSGLTVVNAIRDEQKVVKELTGQHVEGFIVLNTIADHTVNQALVRAATNGAIDVFAVDVWRLQAYVTRLYGDKSEQIQAAALLSELVYTLATAAVLTRGDLPVYLVA